MSTPTIQTASAEQTMELLWSRVKQRGDLPGFSKVIRAIVGAMRGDEDREFNMTKTVLSDPALTQKVLRLANSPMYSVFGQGISTVSKAVIVLGTEAIGHLALGLKLIDGLAGASSDTANARSEMEKAVLSGHIARQVASSASTRDAEEAVVCSMLHLLGRMMVTFYLSDRWTQVQARCVETGINEDAGAHQVLGLGLDDVGRLAGQRWGFPVSLVNTFRDVPPRPVGEPLDHADWLAALATMSARCAAALCADDDSSSGRLATLANDYADMLGLDVPHVLTAVEAAKHTAAEEHSVFVRLARPADSTKDLAAGLPSGKPADAAHVLTHGVADIRDALQSASTNQIMTMALETVHQGLNFQRTVVFLRDHEEAKYTARMCFGEGVQEILPRLVFGDAYQPDVFHAALANDKMIFVENAQDMSFVNKLPRWWRDALPTARSFMVLPLTVNRQPIGFIYGDWDQSQPASKIESVEVLPLNELRALLVRAVDQRRQIEPAWARRMM